MQGSMISVAVMSGLWLIARVSAADVATGAKQGGAANLPLPLGVGLTVYYQDQNYDLLSLDLSVPVLPPGALPNVAVENETREMNLKLDYWALPFLNVFGLTGTLDAETKVKFRESYGLPLDEIAMNYDGLVYGGGVTLCGGGERLFAAVTATATRTDLDPSGSSFDAWVLASQVGIAESWGALWIGATYQDAEETHRGTIAVPMLGSLDYRVKLDESNPWNYVTGVRLKHGERWYFDLEGGFGERQHASLSVTCRF